VNARIANARRERRLKVAPHCKRLIRDLEQVSWKQDANGNPIGDLDRSDHMRTHTSDALEYLIASEFLMRSPVGESSNPLF
jgi:hypothetical protein